MSNLVEESTIYSDMDLGSTFCSCPVVNLGKFFSQEIGVVCRYCCYCLICNETKRKTNVLLIPRNIVATKEAFFTEYDIM